MNDGTVKASTQWNLATEKFFYYCMGLRKGDMGRQVAMMKARYPDDSPERLARRFIAAQVPLSLVGSALIHAPTLLPMVGPAFRFLGLATGTTFMMILNMTLVMQIALLYGYELDDRARLRELLAAITATALTSSSTSLIPQLARLKPGMKAIAGGTAIMTTSQLIGEIAIKSFSAKQRSAETPVQQTAAAYSR